MNIDASLLVIMGIFWVTYAILRAFFFKPLLDLIAAREARIESARQAHETSTREAEAAIAAQRERLQQARQEASAARDALRREAEEQRQATLAAARRQAQDDLAQASTALAAQVDAERVKLAADAQRLGDQMAQRLLGRTA